MSVYVSIYYLNVNLGPFRPVGLTPCCVAAFPEADARLMLQRNPGQGSSDADKGDVLSNARRRGSWFTRSGIVKKVHYTVFQGRAGDHNDLALPGAMAIGVALTRRYGKAPFVIGSPEPALNVGWRVELDAALPLLRQVQARFEAVLADGAVSIAATSRCAVALATLPAVAQHHPAVCVIWMDAHADLNTPDATISGYLGGLALAGPVGLRSSGLGAGLRLDQIVLVGARDLDPFEQELIDKHRIPVITRGSDLASELRTAIAGRPVYVHLDCDVLDPGIVPTDFVVPGGMSLDDLHTCATVIAEHDFVGIEIAEFQNTREPSGDAVSPDPLLDALAPVLSAEQS